MKKLYTFALLSVAVLVSACTRESDESTALSDDAMISLVNQTDVYDPAIPVARMKAQDFRIRMNAIAKNCLSVNGEMSVTYAVNSMLVKEYLGKNGEVTGYDVMYKAPADHNAVNGWLWASYDANGNPTYGVNLKGASCNSCHSKSGNLVLQ